MAIRRSSPEPPWGGPEIRHQPGMADDLMRELAPLLAEDGIDLDDPDSIPDMETLPRALNNAVERRNMQLFTPVGEGRALALTTLRLFVEAIAADEVELAEVILATAVPESPDNTQATVAGTIGVALDLLDQILGSGHPDAPKGLVPRVRLPRGHWTGGRAARDILDLAHRGRAFSSLDALIAKQGSPQVHAGAALALTGVLQAWATLVALPVADVARMILNSES